MSHNFTGVEIGSGTLKLVSVRGGTVRRSAFAPLPDHLVAQGSIAVPELLGDRLRELRRGLRGAPKPAALVLPAEAVISRVVTLPAMSARQLDLNLPYEFKDYISREAGRYRYDYAVQRQLPGDIRARGHRLPEALRGSLLLTYFSRRVSTGVCAASLRAEANAMRPRRMAGDPPSVYLLLTYFSRRICGIGRPASFNASKQASTMFGLPHR